MRLYLYYALHSFKNQLKKIFKSWVIIVILGIIFTGMLFGTLIGIFMPDADDTGYLPEDETVEPPEDGGETEFLSEFSLEFDERTRTGLFGIAAGAIALIFLVLDILNAEKAGNKIFLMADVNLLFASPMTPQAVLSFRLMNQIFIKLVSGMYLFMQIPNLMANFDIGFLQILGIFSALVMLFVTGQLISTFLYTLFSTRPVARKYIRPAALAVFTVAAIGFVVYFNLRADEGILDRLIGYFNSDLIYFIPVFGPIKGMAVFSLAQRGVGFALCAAAALALDIVLALVIPRMRADFYEEAMVQAAQTAQVIERANERRSLLYVGENSKKKRRGESFPRGQGAGVYFYKALFLRFRKGAFGFISLAVVVYFAIGLLFPILIGGRASLWAVCAVLCVAVYWHSLTDPVNADIDVASFAMVPDGYFQKLLCSISGSAVCCAIDVLPALAVAGIISGSPLSALMIVLPLAGIDMSASSVCVFLDAILPVSMARQVRQMLIYLFLNFGIVHNVIIFAICAVFDVIPLFCILCFAFNAGLCLLMTLFSSLIMSRGRR